MAFLTELMESTPVLPSGTPFLSQIAEGQFSDLKNKIKKGSATNTPDTFDFADLGLRLFQVAVPLIFALPSVMQRQPFVGGYLPHAPSLR